MTLPFPPSALVQKQAAECKTIVCDIWSAQEEQGMKDIINQVCGFVTIISGTFLLHATRDLDVGVSDVANLAKPRTGSPGGSASGLQMQALPLHRPQEHIPIMRND